VAEPEPSDRGGRAAGSERPPRADHDETLAHLRELLNGPEQRRLDDLERRLRRIKLRARDVGEVLPDALLMQDPADGRVADALEPHLGKAIQSSVQHNLGAIRDALVPVIGPIIRKYVRSALVSMLENLNRVLDHSFSVRGLRWRWEAWRTGRPFAEVVLLNSLKYRVEQLFLIHRDTGLLLQHVAQPGVASRDPDMVSGMLTAIREFVHDSFDGAEGEDVSSVQIGDFRLVVDADERVALAAVVRGVPPEGLSRRLARTLERISSERRADLEDYRGDDTAFRATRPLLEDHLELELEEPPRRLPVGTVVAATAALAGLAWLVLWVSRLYFSNQEWQRAFELLQAEDGIEVHDAERVGGRWVVHGFRDPLAREDEEILGGLSIDLGKADFVWEEFTCVKDSFVLQRAKDELEPPGGVTLVVEQHVLRVSGRATADWHALLEAHWRSVEGVHSLDEEGLEVEPAPPSDEE
jgi:OOP family OmpA-OmpF porin